MTIIEYCIDMAFSMQEAMRICRPQARMIYVVGRESKVAGYSICNSELIFELATEIFHLPLLSHQQRSFKNRYGQIIYEDILHFSNAKKPKAFKKPSIEKAARAIAIRHLEKLLDAFPESQNACLIKEAIKKAETVHQSRLFQADTSLLQ